MPNSNGWGDGTANNTIGWGQGSINNTIGWGSAYAVSEAGLTDIIGAPAFDSDAQAFITATAITDTTQQNAIDALVIGLKTDLLWTKMLAVYPFVGGTATTCKFNLKNPLDTDAAFRLFFSGGWTFSNNGIQPNGTNTYADTFLAPSTYWTLNDGSVSAYSRTNFNESKVLYGSKGPNFSSVVYPVINTTSASVLHNGLPSVYISPTPTTTAVNLISSRINPNELIIAVNGTAAPYAYTPAALSPVSIYLSARNNNNASRRFTFIKRISICTYWNGFNTSRMYFII
jgi:hypothetical protein